jgi:hypothetical protein
VRGLRTVVQALVLTMRDTGHHLPLGRPVARERASGQDVWRPALPLEPLAERTLRRPPIPPAPDQHVEHHPGLINGTPEPVLAPAGLDDDLITVALASGTGSLRRIRLANSWPTLSVHGRTASWLATTPRAASISSAMRRLSGRLVCRERSRIHQPAQHVLLSLRFGFMAGAGRPT